MSYRILQGDVMERLRELPDNSVHCCVTSPPYWALRDYGVEGQIGLEKTPQEYVAKMVAVFREVRRVLRSDGTCWVNLGDSYAGSGKGLNGDGTHSSAGTNWKQATSLGSMTAKKTGSASYGLKPKDLCMIPARVAMALQADGWWLRSEIVWAKPNGMPGSQRDRCTSSHELIYQLSKSAVYFSDFDAIKTPPRESSMVRLAQNVQEQAGSQRANGGAKTNGPMKAVGSGKQRGHSRGHDGFNDRWDAMEKAEQQSQPAMMRDVWFVSPDCNSDEHFALMPREIARRCILAGCPEQGTVLDPFSGAGTTVMVAHRLGRHGVGIELNPEYVALSERRIRDDAPLFADITVRDGLGGSG